MLTLKRKPRMGSISVYSTNNLQGQPLCKVVCKSELSVSKATVLGPFARGLHLSLGARSSFSTCGLFVNPERALPAPDGVALQAPGRPLAEHLGTPFRTEAHGGGVCGGRGESERGRQGSRG